MNSAPGEGRGEQERGEEKERGEVCELGTTRPSNHHSHTDTTAQWRIAGAYTLPVSRYKTEQTIPCRKFKCEGRIEVYLAP